jgi:hypothetical protein
MDLLSADCGEWKMAENVFPNFANTTTPFDLRATSTQDYVPLESIATGAATLRSRSPCVLGSSSTSAQEWRWRPQRRYLHSPHNFSDHQHEHVLPCATKALRTREQYRATSPRGACCCPAIVVANMFCSGETITKFCVDLLVDKATTTTIRQFDGYGELRWSGIGWSNPSPRPQEGEGSWEVPSQRVRGEFLQVLRWDVRGGSGLFPPWLSWPPLAQWQPTFKEVVPVGWFDSFFPSTHHQHHRRHPHTQLPLQGHARSRENKQIQHNLHSYGATTISLQAATSSAASSFFFFFSAQRRSNRNTRTHPKVPTSRHRPPLPPPKRQIATSRPSSVESCNEEWGEEVRWPESPNHHSKGPAQS